MWKNQIFYQPYDYGQYTDDDGRIFTVKDEYSLENANKTTLTLEYRNSTINPLTNRTYFSDDYYMNARYNGYSLALKGLAFIPSLTVFLIFGILVLIYGTYPRPTKENPYAGRLRKRRRRFNARKKWNSLRTWMRDSTPILTRFKRRGQAADSASEGGKAEDDGGSNRQTRRSRGRDVAADASAGDQADKETGKANRTGDQQGSNAKPTDASNRGSDSYSDVKC